MWVAFRSHSKLSQPWHNVRHRWKMKTSSQCIAMGSPSALAAAVKQCIMDNVKSTVDTAIATSIAIAQAQNDPTQERPCLSSELPSRSQPWPRSQPSRSLSSCSSPNLNSLISSRPIPSATHVTMSPVPKSWGIGSRARPMLWHELWATGWMPISPTQCPPPPLPLLSFPVSPCSTQSHVCNPVQTSRWYITTVLTSMEEASLNSAQGNIPSARLCSDQVQDMCTCRSPSQRGGAQWSDLID